MGEFHPPIMISSEDNNNSKADVMTMANAFRSASDDDTRTVMNAMTNPTTTALASLRFYAVAKSWFVRAWPILTATNPDSIDDDIGENLREYIGKIPNSELVGVRVLDTDDDDEKEGQIGSGIGATVGSSSSDNNHKSNHHHQRFEPSSVCRIPENPDTTKMKPGLVHTRDYFFLGPSAWMLVKEKFGYDGYEIRRSCKKSMGLLAVALLTGEESEESATKPLQSTTLPVSGRFQYEKVILATNTAVVHDTGGNSATTGPSGIKNELSWADQKVEEDETEESSPILLLPPSTTSYQTENNDHYVPLSISSDPSNMEVELHESEGDDDNPTTTTTGVAHAASGRKRLASGLSNMGNTCFMNSTLQCLAHTESLRRYFLSGEYKNDLNRDNPLGTGGELATQFASLMGEMWSSSEPSKRRNVMGQTQSWKYNATPSYSQQAVYPRNFKNSLGKHAEQFMGYDQHDSQELATYLLDALHEDTNRVTKKPYVEKPEQGENESDAEAADTAWKMHLKREDSRVLENFMGQVKSRLECCEDTCDRVSTTFDPFMYLSVPIPGEAERTMTVTFVPLDPDQRMQKLSLTIAKTATILGLLEAMNDELVRTGISSKPIPLHDLCPVEIYDKEIFKWHEPDDEVHGIKDFDKTYVYHLRSLEEVRRISSEDDGGETSLGDWSSKSTKHRVRLDLSSVTELNKGERWKEELEKYSQHRMLTCKLLSANRSSMEEKIKYYKKLEAFLEECYAKLDEAETDTSNADSHSDEESDEMQSDSAGSETLETMPRGMIDCSSTFLPHVKTRFHVGVVEFCANKLRQFILNLMRIEKDKKADGVVVQVGIRQSSGFSMNYSTSRHGLLSTCLVLRLPGNLSVYGLREHLAHRLSRSLIEDREAEDAMIDSQTGESSAEVSPKISHTTNSDCPKLNILLRTCLSYDNSDRGSNQIDSKALGMLSKMERDDTFENGDTPQLAISSDQKELEDVTCRVKNRGHVYLDLEQSKGSKVFDAKEYDLAVVPEDDGGSSSKEPEPDITVLDCIENYCKKEQLEDSEMWYCNKCKTHVRAWKQFHLYRAPPILIIHLKRFFFSASTHRRDKITRKVDFPLEGLDLTDLVAQYGEDDKPIYDCYAVSNHFGGLGGGHYTAYTLSDDGTWCNYDDSRVTTDVNPKDVVSEAAYVLYYRRRDVPIGQDHDILVDTEIAPMICEEADAPGEASELSSNITAPDMDLIPDDTDSNASSKTALSPMEFIDNNDHNLAHATENFIENDRPLQ